MVEMKVTQISITGMGFAILLEIKDKLNSVLSKSRILPIFIGPLEASSISNVLDKVEPQRPLSHDLMKTIIENMNYSLEKIIINDAKKGVLFAKIYFVSKAQFEKPIEVDARPSDAIALALRFGKPIFIEEEIFNKVSIENSLLKVNQEKTKEDAIEEYLFDSNDELSEEEKHSIIETILNDFNEEANDFYQEGEQFALSEKTTKQEIVNSNKRSKSKLMSHADVLQQMLKVAEDKEDYEQAAQLKKELDSIKK